MAIYAIAGIHGVCSKLAAIMTSPPGIPKPAGRVRCCDLPDPGLGEKRLRPLGCQRCSEDGQMVDV